MSEIRRYHKPPKLVHHVMKGVLLLLAVNEEESEVIIVVFDEYKGIAILIRNCYLIKSFNSLSTDMASAHLFQKEILYLLIIV